MKTLLSLLIFAVGFSIHAVAQCNNADDYAALRALYLSTDGDNWTNNTGWPDAATFTANPTPPSDTDMESWYGIVCQAFKGGPSDKVNYVEIEGNNLIGSMPPEMGQMTSLRDLRLNDNLISGNLSALSSLNTLKTLDCWSSYFESRCGALYIYNFEGNQGAISNQGWLDLCGSGAGQCASNCPDSISRTCSSRIGCELVGGTYQAVDSVSYSGKFYISPGVAATLDGSESVTLSDGFTVQQGGILQIESTGCINN